MKKVMFLMAIAGMFAFAACNNTPAEPENIDTPVEAVVAEETTIDTAMAAVEDAAEAVEAAAETVAQ